VPTARAGAGGEIAKGTHPVARRSFFSNPLALLCQFLAARSIIGAAIRSLKRLTEQANLPFNEASKASASRRWSTERPSLRPRRILRGRLAELADRDLVWRRTGRV